MKFLTTTTLTLLSASISFGQDAQRIDSTTRQLPSPAKESVKGSSTGSSAASSDTGAQRPILLKKSGFSANFGFDSDISYKQNPLGAPGKLNQQADAVWENSFHSRAKIGVYDMDSYVLTPYIGAGWKITEFTYENPNEAIADLGDLNFNSTTAYFLCLFQHESGWAYRAGVMYANDRSTLNDTEDYMEFYPSIGATKAYALSENILGVLDASFGIHYGDVEDADGPTVHGHTSDELDHFDITASYSLIYSLDNLVIRPQYSISYRKYDNGFNQNRKDILHHLAINAIYPISESFELELFTDYSNRQSSGTDASGDSFSTLFDFEKFSIGAGFGLTASF